jgi:hypothetical protein
MCPAWMNVSAGSDDARYDDALKFICDGRCVDFNDFGLVVANGVLRIHVNLRDWEYSPERAIPLAHNAHAQLAELLQRPNYSQLLSLLPRQTVFVGSDNKVDWAVGYLSDDGTFVEPRDWKGVR